jgi:hypothetical protein
VFSASDGDAPLQLRWPDAHGRLLLQLHVGRPVGKDGAQVACCTYAEVGCEEAGWSADLEGEMTAPQSHFTLPAATLRDIADDCAPAGARVRLTLRREPAEVVFSSAGPASASVTIRLAAGSAPGGAHSALQSFDCCGERVTAAYKSKFLAQAACMPPTLIAPLPARDAGGGGGEDASLSRVQMDGAGMLRVQHLLSLVPFR